MNRKLRQSLSVLMSTTMVVAQPVVVTYATENEEAYAYQIEYTNEEEILEEEALEEESLEIGGRAVAAVDPQMVYTEFTKTNFNTSGDGSFDNPYNRFEDAIANVEDGGTIVIKGGKGAFLNSQDEYGGLPFVIDKSITIRSEDENTIADLSVRASGIVLQGDVTFENINLEFASKNHDAIFANGHRLELINCTRGKGARQVDLFAGSLYTLGTKDLIAGKNGEGDDITPVPGQNAEIIVRTTDNTASEFGKIFAGSMNGLYNGDVQITIDNHRNLETLAVYSCGAVEAKVGNMFDITEPDPPQENPNIFLVNGNVNVDLTNYRVDIYGKGSDETHVTTAIGYPMLGVNIEDINSLVIKDGKLIPNTLTWKSGSGDLEIAQDAELELSNAGLNTFTVNNLTGGGFITVQRDGKLTVEGTVDGITTFQTAGNSIDNRYSGPIIKDHVYIEAAHGTSDSFKFTPFPNQVGYDLVHEGDTWVARVDPSVEELPDSLSTLDLLKIESVLKVKEIDGINHIDLTDTLDFIVEPSFADPFVFEEAVLEGRIPLDIYIAGEKLVQKTGYDNYGDPYTCWASEQLGIRVLLGVGDDSFMLEVTPDKDGWDFTVLPKNFKSGTYEVVVSLPTYNVQDTTTLHIVNTLPGSDEIKESDLKVEIENGNQDDATQTPVSFGEELVINLQLGEGGVTTFALLEEIEVLVNEKSVRVIENASGSIEIRLPITKENGFTAGSNEVKVLYGGSNGVKGSAVVSTVQVDKLTPNIVIGSDINVAYDGMEHEMTATVDNIANVEPIITYYTDAQGTGTPLTGTPIQAGTYYVKASVTEGDTYEAASAMQGIVTITKVTPDLELVVDAINEKDGKGELQVVGTMTGVAHGSIPAGEVRFTYSNGVDTATETVELNYETAKHTFTGLSAGDYIVTAEYIPHSNELNYEAVSGIEKEVSIRNQVSSVPVSNVTLSQTNLELDLNGKVTQQLIATVTPDTATNQKVTWAIKDETIATVDQVGNVTALKVGETELTVTTEDGKKVATCHIKVEDSTPTTPDNSTPENGGSEDNTPENGGSEDNKPENGGSEDNTPENGGSEDNKPENGGSEDNTPENGGSEDNKPENGGSEDNTPEDGGNDNTPEDDGSDNTPENDGAGEENKPEDSKPEGGGSSSSKPETEDNKNEDNGTVDTQDKLESVEHFKDLQGNWAKEDVQFVVSRGLFKGVSDTHFGVKSPMTRGMIVTVLHRLAGLPQAGETQFTDIKTNAFYKEAVAWAKEIGIVTGMSQDQFAPNQNVTREQLAVMLYQYAQAFNLVDNETNQVEMNFTDMHQSATWAQDAVEWAVSQGILLGNQDGTLNPKGYATRGEVAAMIKRFITLV